MYQRLVRSLLSAPLSDIYGRTIVYVCIALFLILAAGCTLSTSFSMLIAFRFFAGCFGGSPVTIGGAILVIYSRQKLAERQCLYRSVMLGYISYILIL